MVPYVEPPSTLTAAEVSHLFVQHGIKKHNDRYQSVFMKAVSFSCVAAQYDDLMILSI